MKTEDKANAFITLFLLTLFALVVIRRAWVSDDAYITFRTVDNFIYGYGPVWNVGERVQTYTHPLWMFLLSGIYAVTREIHFTSLVTSILISVAAVTLFATRIAHSLVAGSFGILALSLSKGFVDYSTSGLENPMSHLILVIFAILFLSSSAPQKPFWLSFLASLLLLTRLDLALIVAPAILVIVFQNHSKLAIHHLLLGGLPLLAWEGFSLFYYGLPLPNTYYAKLNTGIPQIELIGQGIQYLLNALEFDPLTLLIIIAGVLTTFALRNRRISALALGILLYLAYVVCIGGDFMAGRFLTAPLFLAVILLSQLDFDTLPIARSLMIFGMMIAVGLSAPHATIDFRDTDTLQTPTEHIDHRGISDERLNYAPFTALLALPRDAQPPTHVWAWQGTRDAGKGRELITKFGIGFYGFNAGPGVYVIDQLALADPLLARLPAARDIHWHVGHYIREIPAGYERTLETGTNAIKDPNLALYYDKLSLITRGPLFRKTRLIEIFKMNLGYYDDLIDWDKYRYPELVHLSLDENLTHPKSSDLHWDDPENILFGDSGIEIRLEESSHARWLEISLSSDDDFLVLFLLGGQEIARQKIRAPQYPEGGAAVHQVFVPSKTQETGFDSFRILPVYGENFSLGHVKILAP
ncbi:MAG TPA: hypothetical protein VI451_22530 [Anaerolineales bacterium]|nr:hypothetical protein [Anaerolineales bacterium]